MITITIRKLDMIKTPYEYQFVDANKPPLIDIKAIDTYYNVKQKLEFDSDNIPNAEELAKFAKQKGVILEIGDIVEIRIEYKTQLFFYNNPLIKF